MYVYQIRSIASPDERYIDSRHNLKKRLAEHNARCSPHTSKHAPWRLEVALHFADPAKAAAFERYLKHGSGHAFAHRHFW